jgi:hypothetical protein
MGDAFHCMRHYAQLDDTNRSHPTAFRRVLRLPRAEHAEVCLVENLVQTVPTISPERSPLSAVRRYERRG